MANVNNTKMYFKDIPLNFQMDAEDPQSYALFTGEQLKKIGLLIGACITGSDSTKKKKVLKIEQYCLSNNITWNDVRNNMIAFNADYACQRSALQAQLSGTNSSSAAGLQHSSAVSSAASVLPPGTVTTLAASTSNATPAVGSATITTTSAIGSTAITIAPSGTTTTIPPLPITPPKKDGDQKLDNYEESANGFNNDNNNNNYKNQTYQQINNIQQLQQFLCNLKQSGIKIDLNKINLQQLDLSSNTQTTPAAIKTIKNSMRAQILRQDQLNIKNEIEEILYNCNGLSTKQKDNLNFISGVTSDMNQQIKHLEDQLRIEHDANIARDTQLKDIMNDLGIKNVENKEVKEQCKHLENIIKNLKLKGSTFGINNNNTTPITIVNERSCSPGISGIDKEKDKEKEDKDDQGTISFADLAERLGLEDDEEEKDKKEKDNKDTHIERDEFDVKKSDKQRVIKVSFQHIKNNKLKAANAVLKLLHDKQLLDAVEKVIDKKNKKEEFRINQKVINNGSILNQVYFINNRDAEGFKNACKNMKHVWVKEWLNEEELKERRMKRNNFEMNNNNNNNWNDNGNGNRNRDMYYGPSNDQFTQNLIALAQQQAAEQARGYFGRADYGSNNINNNNRERNNYGSGVMGNRGGGDMRSSRNDLRDFRGDVRGDRNNSRGYNGQGNHGPNLWKNNNGNY